MAILSDKVAIVTGSARGIGRATAELLSEQGAKVLINDLDGDVAEQTASEIDGDTLVFGGDLTKPGVCDDLVAKVIDAWGQVDILVNNAGYTIDAPIHKMSDEAFQRMIDIHNVVPFRMCRAVAPHMREPAKQEREQGVEVFRKIVNVSSISGTMGNAGQANYSSGKSGVIGLTKTLAKEWGQFKINVNAVAFGFIETRLTAVKEESNTMEIDGQTVQLGIPGQMRELAPNLIPLGRPGQPVRGRRRHLPALHAVGQLHHRPGAGHHRRAVGRDDLLAPPQVQRLRVKHPGPPARRPVGHGERDHGPGAVGPEQRATRSGGLHHQRQRAAPAGARARGLRRRGADARPRRAAFHAVATTCTEPGPGSLSASRASPDRVARNRTTTKRLLVGTTL